MTEQREEDTDSGISIFRLSEFSTLGLLLYKLSILFAAGVLSLLSVAVLLFTLERSDDIAVQLSEVAYYLLLLVLVLRLALFGLISRYGDKS